MLKRFFQFLFIILVGLAAYFGFYYQKNHPVQPAKAAGITYYVATTGNDTTGNGSSAAPWATIQKAANTVNPGDTVIVRDGTYTYSGAVKGSMVVLNKGGLSGFPITFKAEHKWGAVLDGTSTNSGIGAGYGFVFGNKVSHVILQDFEIKRFEWTGVMINGGAGTRGDFANGNQYITVKGCHVHHIGNGTSESAYGRCGIFSGWSTQYIIIDGNVIHNNGRTSSLGGIWGHDHGTYSCGNYTQIINNVIYDNTSFGSIQGGYLPEHDTLISNNVYAGGPQTHRTSISIAPNTTNTWVQNNIFYNNPGDGLGAVWWGDETGGSNCYVRNNLSYGQPIVMTRPRTFPGAIVENNIVGPDPLFVAPTTQDFHLQSTLSPAYNTGIADRAPTVDIEGRVRPQGAGFDMGAYEYVTSLTPNITFSKAVDKTSAKSGDIITYTLTYSNTGQAAATTAKIEDLLPANTTFVSASNSGTLTSGKVTWNLGTIAAGVSNAKVTFQVKVN